MTARLLYVEDDKDVRDMMSMLLRNEGYDLVAVPTAEDALPALQAGRFDVLLTDYNLPHRNADWLIQAGRDAGLLDRTRVIVLTALRDPQGVEGCEVLQKPVDIAVLCALIDAAVVTPEATSDCAATPADPNALYLTLYITGGSRESRRATRNLNRVLQNYQGAAIQVAICDVAGGDLAPEALEADRIVVTPTLVRVHPPPRMWVFGDLSQTEAVEDIIDMGLSTLGAGGDSAPGDNGTSAAGDR